MLTEVAQQYCATYNHAKEIVLEDTVLKDIALTDTVLTVLTQGWNRE
ncbi:hypothetical protein JCM19235_715 [Vibrio maritimus]|uniref:Uncharacterized protein n=1 Tax=Vibrio maritimus TaxID=990268 RepID=A0A090RYN5_9VIBR|nr:hypothetical protein JCM19235_715 [Vibrio maritimus]